MRRERLSILGDVLAAILHERGRGADARISNVATRANIAYDRLLPYLEELETRGLVITMDQRVPDVTEKGREFLRHYRSWALVLQTYGLA